MNGSDLNHSTVTRLLHELEGGNRTVINELFPLVYDELRARARRQRKKWQGDHTLNTTALVHEAYLKLVDQSQAEWSSRSHFLGVAAKAMRHILIDYAKHRKADKRGGDVPKLSLEEMKVAMNDGPVFNDARTDALIELDGVLSRLEAVNPRQSQIVECRFFGQMSIAETAEALGLAPATVKRGWAVAQAWLYKEMKESLG
jgi:RNA polymerase sigma factor (TIGR02999 family)